MRQDDTFKEAMRRAKEYLETTSDAEMNGLKLDWESDGYPTSHSFIHSIMADFAFTIKDLIFGAAVSNETKKEFIKQSRNWRQGEGEAPSFHEVSKKQTEDLKKEIEDLKSLLLEFIIRSHLTFPLTELQKEQFEEGLDANKDQVFFPKLIDFIDENQKP